MIYSDSRYANGVVYKANDARTGVNQITVNRIFPTVSSSYYIYIWTDADRLDVLAQRIFGNSDLWYLIMDYNPEIADGLNISPGTPVRIPNG